MHLVAMLEPNTQSPTYPPSSGSSIVNMIEISILVWEDGNDLPYSLKFWRCGALGVLLTLRKAL